MAMPKHPSKTAYDRTQLGPAGVWASIVYHDDRDSYAVASSMITSPTENRDWYSRAVPAASMSVKADDLVAEGYQYATINSFAGKRRLTSECRQVNGVLLDIDAHRGGRAEVMAIRAALKRAVEVGSLPEPSTVVDTGRGVQCTYIFAQSVPTRLKGGGANVKGLKFVRDAQNRLFDAAELAFAGVVGAQVDRSVGDLARVVRLPGSHNLKANRNAELIGASGKLYTLAELVKALPRRRQFKRRDDGDQKAQLFRFDRLNAQRAAKIADLVRLRDLGNKLEGTRDVCFFAYYNAATQVYGRVEALKRLKRLNASATAPLSEREIDHIAKVIDNNIVIYGDHAGEKGFYPLTNATLAGKLDLTAEEITTLNFFGSKHIDKRAAAKRRTAENRRRRDEKICRLYGNGLTQAEVAKRVGCSLHTAGDVIRAAGIERGSLPRQRSKAFRRALDLREEAAASKRSIFCAKSLCVLAALCSAPRPAMLTASSLAGLSSGVSTLAPPGDVAVWTQLALAL